MKDSNLTRVHDYLKEALPWAHGHQLNALTTFVLAIFEQQTGCQAELPAHSRQTGSRLQTSLAADSQPAALAEVAGRRRRASSAQPSPAFRQSPFDHGLDERRLSTLAHHLSSHRQTGHPDLLPAPTTRTRSRAGRISMNAPSSNGRSS